MFPDIRIVWLVRREQNKDLVREAERDQLGRVAFSARSRLLARVVAMTRGFLRKEGWGFCHSGSDGPYSGGLHSCKS
jgi:hypothetical protein